MDESSTLKDLQFDLQLVLGGKRSLPVATLLERLKTLQTELEECEQNSVNLNSLATVSKQLVSGDLLRSRDKRVRAVTACCLADILKLYAVDIPPYNDSELKAIFSLFISQLKELADANNEYYRDRFYLLESLSMVQSILIVKQLSNSAAIMTELFRAIFSLANSGIENKVQVCLVDIMIQLVEEVKDIPREVAESIFEELKQKATISHRMAVELCKNTSEVLQRYVCQYFSDVLLEAKASDSDEDYEQLNEAHELIQEIHRTVPALLLNVIPQLEEETKVDELHVRTLGTKTLGIMFSERSSFIADSYPLVWKSWLNRRSDKVAAIRILVIESLGGILKSHSGLSQDIISCFEQKLLDPEEKVRAAVCKALKQLELDVIKHQVPKSTLEKLSLRCKDKKPLVQQEALSALAFLFDQAYDEILLGSEESRNLFIWIPTAIINCIYVDDNHLTCSMEKVLVNHVMPPNEDSIERSKRLLLVLQSLDDRATKGFLALMQRQHITASMMQRIVEACRATTKSDHMNNGNLEVLIKSVSTKLPEPIRVSNNLRRFCDLSDEELLNGLEVQLDAQYEYSVCRKQSTQILERVEQVLPGTSDTFTALIRRMSVFLFDKESISYLLQLESNSIMDEGYGIDMRSAARKLLKSISSNFPSLLKDHLDNLTHLLLSTSDNHLAEDGLSLLAQLCKQCPNILLLDSNAASKLVIAAKSGSPQEVEYATAILTNACNADIICEDLFNDVCSNLESSNPKLYERLIALNQIAAFTTSYFDGWDQKIADFLISKIREPDDVVDKHAPNSVWVETDNLPENAKLKLVALAILVNRLKKVAKSTNTIPSIVNNVFDLLWSLLEEPESGSSLAIKAQLRLASALAIATLSQLDSYSQLASVKSFEKLALIVQDTVFEVRAGFSQMIIRDLQSGALHPRYFAVLFLLAHEPEKDLMRQIKTFLKKHARVNHGLVAQKSYIEMSLVQLVHLLAHHPDFGESEEDLKLFVPYIELFLDCVATSDNISFLYHIGQKFKATTDAVDPSCSKNSYILSDLACALMQQKCKTSSWSLTSYPGRVKLYTELYTSFATNELQTENMRRTFIASTVLHDKENIEAVNNQSKEKQDSNNNKRTRETTHNQDAFKKPKTTSVPSRKMPSREAKHGIRTIVEDEDDSD